MYKFAVLGVLSLSASNKISKNDNLIGASKKKKLDEKNGVVKIEYNEVSFKIRFVESSQLSVSFNHNKSLSKNVNNQLYSLGKITLKN